ncbi:MAG: glycosyltransferase family 4 protein [Candidatus Moraniibacteriota bacterium]
MKICFVLEHFYPHIGGVEVLFFELGKRLVASGHEVRIVTSDSGGIVGTREYSGMHAFYYRSPNIFGHPVLPKASVEEHVMWADIVHTTTYTAAPTAIALARSSRKPCVISVHEAIGKKWFVVEPNPLKALAFLAFEWFVVTKRYSAWHTISDATTRDLLAYGIDPDRIRMIHLGIDETLWNKDVRPADIASFFKTDPHDKIFLYTGRPGKPKGLPVLLQAIRKVDASLDPSFVFGFILSKNPRTERERFEQSVRASGLTDRIRIIDSVPYDALPGIRKAAFAVIVPSLTEGFGFSAAETAALGTPVIASDAGSLPEVLGGKVRFFRKGDADDLVATILESARKPFPELPEKRFSWDDTSVRLLALYSDLVETSTLPKEEK